MSKITNFLKAAKIFEGLPSLKVGNRLKLAADIISSQKNEIPKGSVVEVIKVEKKGNLTMVHVESIDGETAIMVLKPTDKFIHKIVR